MAKLEQFIIQWLQTVHINLHSAMSLAKFGFSEVSVMIHHALLGQ